MTSLRTRERLLARLQSKGIEDFETLAAVRDVPRHLFVDEALASRAYEDTALPIGHRQTISQPYVVARMTQALARGVARGRVLEVGTGCGYQAAVLAQLFERVFSVERVEALASAARERLYGLGVRGVSIRHGDGHEGWSEHAPFDAIMVCAASSEVPEGLLTQLASGGRLVAPIGNAQHQELVVVDHDGEGFTRRTLEPVVFVPLLPRTSAR